MIHKERAENLPAYAVTRQALASYYAFMGHEAPTDADFLALDEADRLDVMQWVFNRAPEHIRNAELWGTREGADLPPPYQRRDFAAMSLLDTFHDDDIPAGLPERLKAAPAAAFAIQTGHDYRGRVWFESGRFHEEVSVYHAPVKIVSGDTLPRLTRAVIREFEGKLEQLPLGLNVRRAIMRGGRERMRSKLPRNESGRRAKDPDSSATES